MSRRVHSFFPVLRGEGGERGERRSTLMKRLTRRTAPCGESNVYKRHTHRGAASFPRRASLRSARMSSSALEILPSIDLRDGKVVRLKQGDYARQVNYDVDAVATAKSFRDAGAMWLHVVDLDGAKEGRPAQTALIARI